MSAHDVLFTKGRAMSSQLTPRLNKELYRLLQNPDVSRKQKMMGLGIFGAAAYNLFPVDAIPDIVPYLGQMDDMGVWIVFGVVAVRSLGAKFSLLKYLVRENRDLKSQNEQLVRDNQALQAANPQLWDELGPYQGHWQNPPMSDPGEGDPNYR